MANRIAIGFNFVTGARRYLIIIYSCMNVMN